MGSVDDRLKDISEIRTLMEESSKFLSLSGLSGVSAGAVGIAAYLVARQKLSEPCNTANALFAFFCVEAAVTLLFALGFAAYFSTRMARDRGLPVWSAAAKYLVVNLFLPLAAGGAFCLILFHHGLYLLIAPSMLIFYGLALLNSSKYTLREIRYLGLCELCLGMAGALWLGAGLLLWCAGFGALHILYGSFMYLKYEK